MGGMIVQTMAIEHPDRVRAHLDHVDDRRARSASRRRRRVPSLLGTAADRREASIEASSASAKVIGSPEYFDEDRARALAAAGFDRCFYPEGVGRQLLGDPRASGESRRGLPQLDVPTLVIHGRATRWSRPSGGERTAELIPGAELLVFEDMGHDLPRPLWPVAGRSTPSSGRGAPAHAEVAE